MKVLHVIPSISRVHGGPSVAVETMTRGLAQAGVETHVLTTDDDGAGVLNVALGAPVSAEGVTHWFLHRQSHFYKFSLPLAQWLGQHVNEFDLVHIHALFTFATLPAAFFATRARVPYIIRPLGTLNRFGMTQHHRRIKQVSYPLIERRILDGAAAIHYTSEQERREAGSFRIATRSIVLPLAVPLQPANSQGHDARIQEPAPGLAGKWIILFLGRLDPIKGLDLLLDALAQLNHRERNVVLVIAGEGDGVYINRLKERARTLGVADAVLWVGGVQGQVKQAWLRTAQLLVLPSYSENFGIVVIEAMAAGLPVVVSDQTGVSEWVGARRAGLVTHCEPGALAAAITQLCENPDLRKELAQNGQRLARETFSVEATTQALIGLYRELIRAREKEDCA